MSATAVANGSIPQTGATDSAEKPKSILKLLVGSRIQFTESGKIGIVLSSTKRGYCIILDGKRKYFPDHHHLFSHSRLTDIDMFSRKEVNELEVDTGHMTIDFDTWNSWFNQDLVTLKENAIFKDRIGRKWGFHSRAWNLRSSVASEGPINWFDGQVSIVKKSPHDVTVPSEKKVKAKKPVKTIVDTILLDTAEDVKAIPAKVEKADKKPRKKSEWAATISHIMKRDGVKMVEAARIAKAEREARQKDGNSSDSDVSSQGQKRSREEDTVSSPKKIKTTVQENNGLNLVWHHNPTVENIASVDASGTKPPSPVGSPAKVENTVENVDVPLGTPKNGGDAEAFMSEVVANAGSSTPVGTDEDVFGF